MPWGPFVDGMLPVERVARLRGLRVACTCGAGHGAAMWRPLCAALKPMSAARRRSAAFDRLAALDRRRVLAAYGATL